MYYLGWTCSKVININFLPHILKISCACHQKCPLSSHFDIESKRETLRFAPFKFIWKLPYTYGFPLIKKVGTDNYSMQNSQQIFFSGKVFTLFFWKNDFGNLWNTLQLWPARNFYLVREVQVFMNGFGELSLGIWI